jgi:hypothetical protein
VLIIEGFLFKKLNLNCNKSDWKLKSGMQCKFAEGFLKVLQGFTRKTGSFTAFP